MATTRPTNLSPIFIAGPTAVGKSEVALLLAEQLGGELISVDSMQVYRGLDIGTAKPDAAELKRVPHHLLDVADMSEPFDAARFVQLAEAAVAGIQMHGRIPIFCGGTGLYLKAYVDGIGEAPPSDASLRAELERAPLSTLLLELEQHDPTTFERIDRNNPRRVIRAVEVIRLTGRPFSEQRANWSHTSLAIRQTPVFICLAREPGDLHARINARVERMFARGLVAETRRLLEHGLAENRTAMQAIGYRQVVEHLRGERPLRDTIELVKIKTRQFAKRQLTWYRKHAAAEWLEVKVDESPEHTAGRVLAILESRVATQ
jgi:tRNA dimethylallyltransferase